MSDYEHGKLYVYDATSQTFDPAAPPSVALEGMEITAEMIQRGYEAAWKIDLPIVKEEIRSILSAALTRPQLDGSKE